MSSQIYYQFIQTFENIIAIVVEGNIAVLKKKKIPVLPLYP